MYAPNGTDIGDLQVAELLKHARPITGRALVDLIVWGWGVMLFGIAVYILFPNIITFAFAFAVVTSRMGALLALAHEAQHAALLPVKKWNDIVGAWLCAYPVGSIFGSSRAVHMAHHKLLGTSDDPDRDFHLEENKATPRDFVLHFARRVFGGQLWTSIVENGILRARRAEGSATQAVVILNRKGHPEILNLVPVQIVIWGTLWLVSQQWWLYFVLWMLPIFTTGTFLGYLRGFVDHAKLSDDPAGGDMEGRLVTVLHCNFLERAYLAPYDFRYHAEHHMFPSVPHYYLPELHKACQASAVLREKYLLRESYGRFLADYWHQIYHRVTQPVSEH
ncbi:MAG TPA: fatty acid desaturase [Candidatus Obscuribacterales bacterium]